MLSEAALFLTRARVNIQKFVRLADPKEYAAFTERFGEARAILTKLSQEVHGEERATVERLIKDADSYKAAADQLDEAVLGISEVFSGILDPHGPKAEKALAALLSKAEARGANGTLSKLAHARGELLLSRIRAQQFFISGDPKKADEGQEFIKDSIDRFVLSREGSIPSRGRARAVERSCREPKRVPARLGFVTLRRRGAGEAT